MSSCFAFSDGCIWQLSARKCPECGQTLPISYESPADEDWSTGICGCAEDPESCKGLSFSIIHEFHCKSPLHTLSLNTSKRVPFFVTNILFFGTRIGENRTLFYEIITNIWYNNEFWVFCISCFGCKTKRLLKPACRFMLFNLLSLSLELYQIFKHSVHFLDY